MSERPIRVAVIGGGCAALTAAFELTRPQFNGRFEVTVYQMGFRLGGKGASGRGKHDRIEEHGLHLWMGYYENAFRLMRECYAEWNQPQFKRAFDDAFFPAPFNAAMDRSPDGTWTPWKVNFPPMPGLPGDTMPPQLRVADYLEHAVKLLVTLLGTLASGAEVSERKAEDAPPPGPDELRAAVERLGKYTAVAGLGVVLEALRWLAMALSALDKYSQSTVGRLVDVVSDLVRGLLSNVTQKHDEARRLWEVADLILATVRGVVRHRVAFHPQGFDALDDYDCREWLLLNGASLSSVNSAFIRALYDLAFAYEGGDPNKPAIAAGSALRGAFRAFFSYRGAFFWKMNGGMGDVVFAPLYEVLKRRGVRFEFFHRLTTVELAEPARTHVEALHFEVQAKVNGEKEYEPLVDVHGLPCWPAEPDYGQLVGGHEARAGDVAFEQHHSVPGCSQKRLVVARDFDFVVLGVGLGTVAQTCVDIARQDERWRQMLTRVKTVPTQAFQLWLRPTVNELGWSDRAVNLSGFVEPFDTWADMTHLNSQESWPTPPGTIAYFCNALPDSVVEHAVNPTKEQWLAARAQVRDNCLHFLNRDVKVLWPRAVAGAEFDWRLLCHDTAGHGHAFDAQYWTANVNPSDRYSQALPGTTRYRISPLDTTYDNLTLAGDWTSCGINMGCVEAAVMSGRLAAHALSGSPRLEDITGYDHP